ncbi:hypothetical protein NC652_023322 [Populus alba x Populus x berolinensis]|nr:hypothetical protein NC652_023322 [Populus alba x Populus x berolinensis]
MEEKQNYDLGGWSLVEAAGWKWDSGACSVAWEGLGPGFVGQSRLEVGGVGMALRDKGGGDIVGCRPDFLVSECDRFRPKYERDWVVGFRLPLGFEEDSCCQEELLRAGASAVSCHVRGEEGCMTISQMGGWKPEERGL